MLCPNCKTELIDVNGRYICSDCGKEVPENEVMTSDWGNSTPVADGLYDNPNATTSTPEEGSMPVAAFSSSLTETENEIDGPSVEEVLQEQGEEIPVSVPLPVSPEIQTVEDVLQDQADEVQAENQTEESDKVVADNGFYAPPSAQPESPASEPEVEVTVPETPVVEEVEEQSVPSVTPPPEPEPTPDTTQIPQTPDVQVEPTNTEPVPTEKQPVPENIPSVPEPEQKTQEVVKDMFDNVPPAPVSDPGLYANNYEETPAAINQNVPTAINTPVPMPNEKKLNLLIIILGAIIAISLIGGGTWAYIALSKPAPVVVPVVNNPEEVVWQDLQVLDAGFKISFPGQPEKTENTEKIGGIDTLVISQSYTTGDIIYTAAYAPVNAGADKLPMFVDELATSTGFTVATTKVGKYYTADAIDFTLTLDSSTTQGKIMLRNNLYILVLAGSTSDQAVDYDKFIKSFSFITN